MKDFFIQVSLKNGELSILITEEFAKDYYDFLIKKGVTCTSPKTTEFLIISIYFDENGNKKVVQNPSVKEIKAQGTYEKWKAWTNAWLDKVTGK